MKVQFLFSVVCFAASVGFAIYDAHTGGPKGLPFFYSLLFFVGGFVAFAWGKHEADEDLTK